MKFGPILIFQNLFAFEIGRHITLMLFEKNSMTVCILWHLLLHGSTIISEYLLLPSCLGPKKQGCWIKINCSQMKLPNFVSPSSDSLSKSADFGLSK